MRKLLPASFSYFIVIVLIAGSASAQSFCGFTCEDCLKQAFISNNKVKVITNISYASPAITDDFADYQISKSSCVIDSTCLYGSAAAQNSLLYDVYYPNLNCGSYPLLPAIILFHGGGFSECTTKAGMEDYCRDF